MIPSRQALLATAAFALVACGMAGAGQPVPAASATASRAADFRVHLDTLLGEHVLLGAKVTGAALGTRTDEYTAYSGLLTHNGTDVGALLGGVLGTDVRDRSDQLWAAHDAALVQYTAAVAARDPAARARAAQQLDGGFAAPFAELFSGATGVPASALTELAGDHVQRIEQLVDDQAAGSWTAAYADLRSADADTQEMGDALVPTIVRRAASRLPGTATGRAVDLRVRLDQLLQEHAYLSTGAAAADIAGRSVEFQAAQEALSDNGTDLGKALGASSGPAAQSGFDRLWTAHDVSFVDYMTAVARGDRTSEERAAADLDATSVPQFASFLADTTSMRQGTLTNLLKEHVAMTEGVIDSLGRHDPAAAARQDRAAARHMAAIGDPVAAALVAKLPQKFQ